jgi:hypothetical protein
LAAPLEAGFGVGKQTPDVFMVLGDDEKRSGSGEPDHLRHIAVRLKNPYQEREQSHGDD